MLILGILLILFVILFIGLGIHRLVDSVPSDPSIWLFFALSIVLGIGSFFVLFR